MIKVSQTIIEPMEIEIIQIVLDILFVLEGIFGNGLCVLNMRFDDSFPYGLKHSFLNILKLKLSEINRINIRKCFGRLLFLSITNLYYKLKYLHSVLVLLLFTIKWG